MVPDCIINFGRYIPDSSCRVRGRELGAQHCAFPHKLADFGSEGGVVPADVARRHGPSTRRSDGFRQYLRCRIYVWKGVDREGRKAVLYLSGEGGPISLPIIEEVCLGLAWIAEDSSRETMIDMWSEDNSLKHPPVTSQREVWRGKGYVRRSGP